MNLKGLLFADVAETQETVTDKIKKVQKLEFSTAFQEPYDRAKPYILYMSMGVIFNKKKCCLTHVSSI